MKIEQIGDEVARAPIGFHPMSEVYFDGYRFSAETPTHASPSYDIYRNDGVYISVTSQNSAAMTTYGIMLPLLKIVDGSLYIVQPYYDGTNYNIKVTVMTDYNTATNYTGMTGFGSTNYTRPLDVFVYDSKIVIPSALDLGTEWDVYFPYYSGTTTDSYYSQTVEIDENKIAYGGRYDGVISWYGIGILDPAYIPSEAGKTLYFDFDFVTPDEDPELIYVVDQTDIMTSDADVFQWMWVHEETVFFFDSNGGNVYRGKYDVVDSFTKILTGAEAYGQYFDTDMKMVGITTLGDTNLKLWKVFYEGAIEGYNYTETGVVRIPAASTYGYHYDSVYVLPEQVSYTPLRTEELQEKMFEAPTYKISTRATTYYQYLHLYDDSGNPWFIGHVINVIDNVENPERVIEYGSPIRADLERKITLTLTSLSDKVMIEQVCAYGTVCLTPTGGSIVEGDSYTLVMNKMSFREFARWLFFRTKKLLRWDALGVLTFDTCTADSGVDIISTNIISSFSVQNETLKYGSVQLDGNGISVQAPIVDGGDDVLYDIYPNIDSVSELQAIADNMAEMKFNQVNKIQVAVRDTGKLEIGELVDVVYNPTDKIDADDSYIIIGQDYIPFGDVTRFYLSNALFVEKVMDQSRQTQANTQAISTLQKSVIDIETSGAVAAHASTHGNGGSDEVSIDGSQITAGTVNIDRMPDLSTTVVSIVEENNITMDATKLFRTQAQLGIGSVTADDASLHIDTVYGGNGRFTQIGDGSNDGLNLMIGSSGEWWAWGVYGNNFRFAHGTDFTTTPIIDFDSTKIIAFVPIELANGGTISNAVAGFLKLTDTEIEWNGELFHSGSGNMNMYGNGDYTLTLYNSYAGKTASLDIDGGLTLGVALADAEIASSGTWNAKEDALTFSSPLSRSTNTISLPAATTSVNGYLTSTDWNTFNSKISAASPTLTGTVTISGSAPSLVFTDTDVTRSSSITFNSAVATSPLLFETNNSYQFNVDGNSRLTIGDTGIVYFGTGAASYKVDTGGNATFNTLTLQNAATVSNATSGYLDLTATFVRWVGELFHNGSGNMNMYASADTTLTLYNSYAGNVTNLDIDGGLTVGSSIVGPPRVTFSNGEWIDNEANGYLDLHATYVRWQGELFHDGSGTMNMYGNGDYTLTLYNSYAGKVANLDIDGALTLGTALADSEIASASTWNAKVGSLSDLSITATSTEINRACDGITATAAEINTACDGSTAKNSHTHSYYPLSGGTLTGNTITFANGESINNATNSYLKLTAPYVEWVGELFHSGSGNINVYSSSNNTLTIYNSYPSRTTTVAIDGGLTLGTKLADAYISSASTWSAKASTASPTFSGTVTLPTTSVVGHMTLGSGIYMYTTGVGRVIPTANNTGYVGDWNVAFAAMYSYSYTDRTPACDLETAKAAVKSFTATPEGEIDHDKLHSFIATVDEEEEEIHEEINGKMTSRKTGVMKRFVGRNLGASISANMTVLSDLLDRVDVLEAENALKDEKILTLEARLATIEKELGL